MVAAAVTRAIWRHARPGTLRRFALAALCLLAVSTGAAAQDFDHEYGAYAELLRTYVRGPRVDYAALEAGRAALDCVVQELARADATEERSWRRAERLAFWINAYNVFTLRAIIDHYPIGSSRGRRATSGAPANSIRQIDGVWTALRWKSAGRDVTLDQIEHGILRREIGGEPRIHFAVNCASVSCPPLAAEPYRATTLDTQLDEAARRYLASEHGVRVNGSRLLVSSIFKWYGDDFVPDFGPRGPESARGTTRAILGVLASFAPEQVRRAAASGHARVAFLDYDWSLNDVRAARASR
jgi:hypothetical protein